MKKRDIILIGGILALALVFLSVYYFIGLSKEQSADSIYVSVEVDGREIARYNITDDGEYPLNGGTNTLRIENGEAYLISATCPDHLCVNMGKVRAMKPIVCLPNRLTVTLHGVKGDVDLVN